MTFLQHELVVNSTCGLESSVSYRVPLTLRQVCAALLLTADTPGHLSSVGRYTVALLCEKSLVQGHDPSLFL